MQTSYEAMSGSHQYSQELCFACTAALRLGVLVVSASMLFVATAFDSIESSPLPLFGDTACTVIAVGYAFDARRKLTTQTTFILRTWM